MTTTKGHPVEPTPDPHAGHWLNPPPAPWFGRPEDNEAA